MSLFASSASFNYKKQQADHADKIDAVNIDISGAIVKNELKVHL